MKKLYSIIGLFLLLTGCTTKPGFQISGQLSGVDSDTMFVYYLNMAKGLTEKCDTIVLQDNGKFAFNVSPDTVYPLAIIRKPSGNDMMEMAIAMFTPIHVLAVPGEEAVITGDFQNYKILGTQLYQDIDQVNTAIKPYQEEINRLGREALMMEQRGVSADSIKQVRAEQNRNQNQITEYVLNYIKENPKKKASATLLNYIIEGRRMEGVNMLDASLFKGVMGTYVNPLAESLRTEDRRLKEGDKIKKGSPAPDFTLKNLEGKAVSLSDFKGKYVIIDFWGSWCGYCIQGFPDLKEAYTKYKDRLEVIGIDCRDKDENWRKAVEEHALPWVNVKNEEGDNDLSVIYGVSGYPTKLIVNPEGIIEYVVAGETPEFYKVLDELMKS